MRPTLCSAVIRLASTLGCAPVEREPADEERSRLKRELEALRAENAELRQKLAFRGPWF